ncbi:hypothetical protein [Nocardia sp. NPDC056100]|uniref:hypothetical protein n=1 Tax=Nocardia sp. NPDC056100 TaxID=3345712 RepID=UPI0035D710AF
MTGNDAGSIVGRTNAVAPHGDNVASPATTQLECDTTANALPRSSTRPKRASVRRRP